MADYKNLKSEKLKTDVLIIGGGTAGCYAAITISEKSPETQVLICEKAHIKRSGCLAAGVNALNAYITEGRKPQDYVDYAKKDADGIVREDLLLTMSERLNAVTARLEELGLVILKDENGKYVICGYQGKKQEEDVYIFIDKLSTMIESDKLLVKKLKKYHKSIQKILLGNKFDRIKSYIEREYIDDKNDSYNFPNRRIIYWEEL